MGKITVKFKRGGTREIDESDLPRIKNIFPSAQVVKVEQAKPPKAKVKTVAEFNQISEEVEGDLESNDKNTISGE